MTGREPAWRVLAFEVRASLHEERGTGDRAATHLLSPLGARMNRVLMAGDLSAGEALGQADQQPFYRAKLTDGTGEVTVTAGGFQPRALAGLRSWTVAGPALVVGKAHLFKGRDGTAYPSVRAEAIRGIAPEEVRRVQAEAVAQTGERVRLVQALRAHRDPRALEPAPVPAWIAAAEAAIARYPSLDPATLAAPLASVGAPVPRPAASAPTPVSALPAVRVTRAPPRATVGPPSAAERAVEASFLDIVDELAEDSSDGYADLRQALERAAAHGLPETHAEELLNRLEEAGVLEEPIVGKLRRA